MRNFALFLTFAGSLFLPYAALADEEEAKEVGGIRALYAKISQAEPSKTDTIEFEIPDDPMSGTITRRSYEGGLSAIKLSYTAGDHGGSDQNFYYDGKGLFFILVQDSSWQFAEGSTDEKPKTKDTLTEIRYYIREGKVIQALKRSATSDDPAKLRLLLEKAENTEFKPKDEEDGYLLKRAEFLMSVAKKEEAVKYFSKEK
ncbi:hypothetical protein [Luteolibacter luteus]|uniref:Uncharacterized protein n=1 Tax=Luteolibacter luteus TaxID=2728835 RepID=A0A858RLI3_9BACT|nr:hypothetical protein [Luteolibacter luteus]QJE97040.1 hypothetical protein HHL09_15010 [Luteolibacter luteus]